MQATAAPTHRPESKHADLDRSIGILQEHKDAWASLPLDRRIRYLRGLLDGSAKVAERHVRAACAAKGIPFDAPVAGEEWLAGPVIQVRVIRLLLETLEKLAREDGPSLHPGAIHPRPDGQTTVDVFPLTTLDKLLYQGFTARIWLPHGVGPGEVTDHMAAFYREAGPKGKVALVLGAGNVASIGPLDLVHKLFVEGQVGLLKFNPVNDYTGPFVEEAFAELIRDGFVQTCYGGGDVGEYLTQHPGIDEIHMTGSDRTHDAIVFGVGDEGKRRKAANDPRITKRITSELGNVSPIIVVPGEWSTADIDFHAQNVATQLAQNVGFNCNAARVIITHADWPQRKVFIERIGQVLASLPQRPAYYPGAEGRLDRFIGAHPDTAVKVGKREGQVLPWTLLPSVDASNPGDITFTTEAFAPVTAETPLSAESPAAFLEKAVAFANDTLWGTLNAEVIIDPAAAARLAAELDQALADLRYGSVAVNHWPALSYALGSTSWGAFPGHTLDDIQSGIGAVHNTLLFDAPEKTVIHGPFRVRPKPPWFVTHARAHEVARRMLTLEHRPSMAKVPGLLLQAIRG